MSKIIQQMNILKQIKNIDEKLTIVALIDQMRLVTEKTNTTKSDLQTVVDAFKKLREDTTNTDELQKAVLSLESKITADTTFVEKSIDTKLTATEKKLLQKITKDISDIKTEILQSFPDGFDPSGIYTHIDDKVSPTSLVDSLESLSGDDRLSIKAIKDVPEFEQIDYSTEIAELKQTVAFVGSKQYAPAGIEIFRDGRNFGRIPSINFKNGNVEVSASRVDVDLSGTGGGGGGTGGTLYIDQTSDNGTYGLLAGLVNGSNTTFTVSQGQYTSGNLTVYRNGVLQHQGASDDWQETTPSSGTFTFVTAPLSGDIITVQYGALSTPSSGGGTTSIIGGSYISITGTGTLSDPYIASFTGGNQVYNEVLSASVDGITTVFTTSLGFISGTTRIYWNGIRQVLGVDYTETSTNQITFTTAPTAGSVTCDYEKLSGVLLVSNLLLQDGSDLLQQDGSSFILQT